MLNVGIFFFKKAAECGRTLSEFLRLKFHEYFTEGNYR